MLCFRRSGVCECAMAASDGSLFPSGKATEQAVTLWHRVKGQKHNLLGMVMMCSVFLLSTRLLTLDKELTKVKKSHEESLEEADEIRRKVKGLRESILAEVSRAGTARDSMVNLRSRLQVLMDERFADLHISQQGAAESAAAAASSNNEVEQQSDKSFMV